MGFTDEIYIMLWDLILGQKIKVRVSLMFGHTNMYKNKIIVSLKLILNFEILLTIQNTFLYLIFCICVFMHHVHIVELQVYIQHHISTNLSLTANTSQHKQQHSCS